MDLQEYKEWDEKYKNDPDYIAYLKECKKKREKWIEEISLKNNLELEYVRAEISKGPFSGSSIWDLICEDKHS